MVWFFKKKDKDKNSDADVKDIPATEDENHSEAEDSSGAHQAENISEREMELNRSTEAEEILSAPAPDYEAVEVVEKPVTSQSAAAEANLIKEDNEPDEKKGGWLSRLTSGLSKSSSKMTENIASVITNRKLDDETLEELEEALIIGDLGPSTSAKITAALSKKRYGKDISDVEVREALAEEIAAIIQPVAQPLEVGAGEPHVILFAGVNGSGKTTTIGKLAKRLTDEGKTVMLAAGDTFRAAAVEQLKVWGERTGCPVVAKDIGADAGALAFEAMEQAKKADVDVLLIDTAGRLQNKSNLMDELQKVVRVIQKHDSDAPHQTILVLDATTGQNAHSQVDLFDKAVDVTGLVVTKLDGSAKGGVIVSLAERFQKPIHAIGVGEKLTDLQAFNAEEFSRSLMGLPN